MTTAKVWAEAEEVLNKQAKARPKHHCLSWRKCWPSWWHPWWLLQLDCGENQIAPCAYRWSYSWTFLLLSSQDKRYTWDRQRREHSSSNIKKGENFGFRVRTLDMVNKLDPIHGNLQSRQWSSDWDYKLLRACTSDVTGYSVKLYLNTSLKPKMDLKELRGGTMYNLRKKSHVLRTPEWPRRITYNRGSGNR